MYKLIAFAVAMGSAAISHAQGPGPGPGGGTGTAGVSYLKLENHVIEATHVSGNVYEVASSVDFEAYCDTTVGAGNLHVASELMVGFPSGPQDTISTPPLIPQAPWGGMVVTPGQTLTWTLDNEAPGPVSSFAIYSDTELFRSFAGVHGFRVGGWSPPPKVNTVIDEI